MAKRGDWKDNEEEFLIKNYSLMTIKELVEGLRTLEGRNRTDESVNSKIKRLKAEGKIQGGKESDTVYRSLTQRRR